MTSTSGDAPDIPGVVFRPATTADWPAMADVVNRSRNVDGVDEVWTGEELAAEHAVLTIERDVLVAVVDGTVVGHGIGVLVQRDGVIVAETEGAVDPGYRRRGIGTALFRRSLARLRAAAEADPRPGPREVRAYALDEAVSERALLDAEGFLPIRFGYEMRRSLTGALPDHPLPAGLELRPVTPDAHRQVFDADDEAFEDHWGHRTATEEDFHARYHGPDVDTSLWCVAWDGDEVAGVVVNLIVTHENAVLGIRRGWLEHVSVRRPWRGRGVAKALCSSSFRMLRDRGMDEAWLGVDGSNPTGAVRLYEGLGFHVVRGWKAYGRPIDGPAPRGWRSGSPPADTDDAKR
jgi:mycothiol synthase